MDKVQPMHRIHC